MSGRGVGALYLLFIFVEMSYTSDIILLKQVVVLQIAHRAVVTPLEASKRNGGLLQALTSCLFNLNLIKKTKIQSNLIFHLNYVMELSHSLFSLFEYLCSYTFGLMMLMLIQ